jgi:hypothetical protein
MNSNDLLAKLLANENLTIVRGNVITASFDINQRVLVLPQWKDMPEVTEEMLILHEVGHALYTTEEYSDSQKDQPKIFGHYLNVIEDARIERKMKHRYPGSRKSFIQGYKELNDRDFFKIKNHDLNDLSLIDRINLFYKAGMNCGVKFNETEQKFINEIDKSETIYQVIDIAKRVYDYAKLTAQEEVEIESLDNINLDQLDYDENDDDDLDDQLNNGNFVSSEETTEEDDDEDSYEYDNENDNGSGSSRSSQPISEYEKEKRIEEKMRASTMEALDDNLKSSADTNTIFKYYEPDFNLDYSSHQPIVNYKTALGEMKEAFVDLSLFDHAQKAAISFRDKNNSIVNNMVKEFEMRKSASAWKRAQISKTGQLDAKKIYGYKIKDELFKQLTVVKNGKQHGMVFLLDWSGSMDQYMLNTIKQLINLVVFAKRINVPFQVFAFSSVYTDSYKFHDYDAITNLNGLGKSFGVTLIELFSNKMSEREMLEMSGYLLTRVWYNCSKYSLGGTPLNEALILMIKHIGKFIKNNNVEKTIFITLTDGEGNALYGNNGRLDGVLTDFINNTRCKVKHYIKDNVTGKQYEIDQCSDSQTRALLNLIKDRYNSINIGFNLINNNYGAISRFIKNVVGFDSANIYNIQVKMRSEKYYKIAYSGYTTYYLVDNRGLDIKNETDLDKVSSTMTANQVSKALTKVMNTNKSSRIILNNFVTEIA